MKIIKRLIPHEHQYIPIIYGLLTKTVDEKGNIISPIDYVEGGCVVREEKYQCKFCGKKI